MILVPATTTAFTCRTRGLVAMSFSPLCYPGQSDVTYPGNQLAPDAAGTPMARVEKTANFMSTCYSTDSAI
jgi:hypothetical protein